jgi:undecaprenyl-diphosphatase
MRSEAWTAVMKAASFLVSDPVMWAANLLLAALALWRFRRLAWIPVAVAGASLITEILKLVFHRARPALERLVEVTGYSYPSGHATTAAAFFGALAVLAATGMKSRLRWALAALSVMMALLVGWSRVYLGVHYASDVLGGIFVGLAWLAAVRAVIAGSSADRRPSR